MKGQGIGVERFGWASVQADGGIESVVQKAEEWARTTVERLPEPAHEQVGLGRLRLGLSSVGQIGLDAARTLAALSTGLVGLGATVVAAQNASLLAAPAYLESVFEAITPAPTLGYGQTPHIPGFHIMETPTDHWVETLTGLAATGVDLVLVYTSGHPVQGHRMVPVLQVTADQATAAKYANDLDLVLEGDPAEWLDALLQALIGVASRTITPKAVRQGNIDFQFTRGLLGVSM